MSKLIPDYVFDSIYDITPEVLTAHGVRGVLVDLDGTMASHKAALPPDTLHTFVDRLKNAGIAVLVFSNNHPERVGKFCEPLGVGYISHAGKPFRRVTTLCHEPFCGVSCFASIAFGYPNALLR